MKYLKKLAGVLLALVMVMALAAPAFAATGSGTITISNATVGEDYSIYKIFSATYDKNDQGDNEVEPTKAAYTIKSTDAWYTLVSGENSPFALTQIGTSDGYNVTLKADKQDKDVLDWLSNIETLPTPTKTQENVQSVTVEFTGVEHGYYLVKSSVNGGGTLTVDNANPNAEVIDKNQEPGNPTKAVTKIDGVKITKTTKDGVTTYSPDNSAEIGDEMEFKITYTATNYIGDKKIIEYKIEDDMPEGFTLTDNSISVKVKDVVLKNTAYTIAYDNPDTGDFTVTIPWVGTDNDKPSLYDSPAMIEVTYKATMNSDATIDGAGNTNTAKITYKDIDNEDHHDPDKDVVTETVYTYALAIKKVNKDGQPLADVKFTLTDAAGTAINVTGANGVYTVDKNSETNEVVTDANGMIIVKGLKNVEYLLTETETNAGYNLLTAPVEITPVKIGETTTTVTKYIDDEGKVTDTVTDVEVKVENSDVAATVMVVVNFTGSLLPSTGGIGTTIFYIVGGVLAVGAVVVLIAKRRTGAEEE